jgi:hypothetical protein
MGSQYSVTGGERCLEAPQDVTSPQSAQRTRPRWDRYIDINGKFWLERHI